MNEPVVRLSHYIAGEWLAVNGQEWTADINPSNVTEVLARVPSADATAVNRAAEAAHSGFERWRAASGPQRAEILHQSDAFLDRLQAEIRALPLAPAIDPGCAVGPLITPDAVEKVNWYAEMGFKMGQVVIGGHRPDEQKLKQGFFFEPTVVADVPNDAPLVLEEIFGPLLVVQRARSIDEVLSLANSTKFGLSVSLFTRDINAALRYIQDIKCGMVRVNGDTTGVDPHAPFGGMRASSSHSREQGPAAIEFFTETKTVQINPASGL